MADIRQIAEELIKISSEDVHNLKQEIDMYSEYHAPSAPVSMWRGSRITHNTKKPTKCETHYTNEIAKRRKKNKNKKTHRR